jgi:hypothetical protein
MAFRSPFLRALLFLLAFVPVAWGTCPRWVAGEACGASHADPAHGDVARCPCCPAAAGNAAGNNEGPDGRSPTDPASCPVIQLRFTVAPAPTDVVMPAIDLVVLATTDLRPPTPVVTGATLAPRDVSGGAPPPRVGTVVLRI